MRSSPLFIAAALVLLTAACSDPASNDSNNGTTNNGTTNSGTSTNGDTSGANVATNGDTNGAPNGETNGNTNGNPNGETNGSTNGQTNGTNNGTTNTNNGTGCPDALEPNDTRDEATPVSSGDVVESRLCDDDDLDLFAIDLTDGQTLTASATFEANTHNLDMTLFTEEQAADFTTGDTGVAFTFAMGETPEVLEHAVDADGTYYLLIFNNNFVAAEYTLEFDVE